MPFIGPLGTIDFAEGYRVSSVLSARGGVGIAPYAFLRFLRR